MIPALEELDNFLSPYYTERQYSYLPTETEKDKINRLILVVADEILYILPYSSRFHNRLKYGGLTWLEKDEKIKLITEALYLFNTKRSAFVAELEAHNKRLGIYGGRRYMELYRVFTLMVPDKECCQCHTRQDIQLDHVLNHNSFKNEKLAYSLDNLQWLCRKCNSVKGPSNAEHRSAELIKHIQEYISSKFGGDALIK